MRTPRTAKEIREHPAVYELEHSPHDEVRWWIHLKAGFKASSDPLGVVHCGNGHTLKEAIQDTFPVRECDCSFCR